MCYDLFCMRFVYSEADEIPPTMFLYRDTMATVNLHGKNKIIAANF